MKTVATLAFCALLIPSFAFAQTHVPTKQERISYLQHQIQVLQAELTQLQGTSTPQVTAKAIATTTPVNGDDPMEFICHTNGKFDAHGKITPTCVSYLKTH